MTDKTKELFDAPWTVTVEEIRKDTKRFAVVKNNLDYELVAIDLTHEDAHRLARLPELYDALMETVYYKCFECMGGLRHNIDMTREELIKNGCPKQNKSNVCIYVKHIDLLKKVRAGK